MTSSILESEFCTKCGTILPVLRTSGGINCFQCNESYEANELGNDGESHYVVHFNSVDIIDEAAEKRKKKKDDDAEGPVVERKCPKCGNDVMSYATLQLRSADEGQTVFYTCTKCKYKETENS